MLVHEMVSRLMLPGDREHRKAASSKEDHRSTDSLKRHRFGQDGLSTCGTGLGRQGAREIGHHSGSLRLFQTWKQPTTWNSRVLREMRSPCEEVWRRFGVIHDENLLLPSEGFKVFVKTCLQVGS